MHCSPGQFQRPAFWVRIQLQSQVASLYMEFVSKQGASFLVCAFSWQLAKSCYQLYETGGVRNWFMQANLYIKELTCTGKIPDSSSDCFIGGQSIRLKSVCLLCTATASSRNLWVSGLSSSTRATDLKSLFGKHGKVSDKIYTCLSSSLSSAWYGPNYAYACWTERC